MSEKTPWRCLHCKQLRKHSVTYCCNQPWQTVMDHTYIHQPRHGQDSKTNYTPHWGQDRPWGQGWRDSPRQRVQSPRHRKGGHHQGGNQGGNTPRAKSHARGQGQKGKGKGKGDVPMPPPQPHPMPWPGYYPMAPQMNPAMMMPNMMNPTQMVLPMSSGMQATPAPLPPPPVNPMTAEQQAREQKMQELMIYLKKRGPDLPSDVTQRVQEITKKDGAQAK